MTADIGGRLYHACHRDELNKILEDDKLRLRSEWSLKLPKHGLWAAPGTWTGLNYFHIGNYYGPFLFTFPLSVLNGRHFMVFRRQGDKRHRYFFVQYEARIPIYSFGRNLWRKVDPYSYFENTTRRVSLKPGAIYDIVLTTSVELDDAEVGPVEHSRCISGKCGGVSRSKAEKILQRVATREFYRWLERNRGYARLFKRFRVLGGEEVELPDPLEVGKQHT
ncbi:MAG: hypothetical protein WD688_22650 [Candidatus Binatia bacterium]